MMKEDRQIRQNILELLYDSVCRGQYNLSKSDLEKQPAAAQKIDVSSSRIKLNLEWLALKGYVKYDRSDGGNYYAIITGKGIDHITVGKELSQTGPSDVNEQNESSM